MMGSLFSSISGLRNHTTWMNTIGNNISNVNTVGYKAQRVTFKEQITQMMGAASSANLGANIGGRNPQQMGLGAALGSIDTIMTQGAIQTTGNPLDVALTGDGFFQVKVGSQSYYTRAGNFSQDNYGNVVTSTGAILQGWMGGLERTITQDPLTNPEFQIRAATYTIDTSDVSNITNIQVSNDMTLAAQKTNFMQFAGNLDSNTPLNVYATAALATVAGGNGWLPSNFSPSGAPTVTGGQAVALGDPPGTAGGAAGVRDGIGGTNYFFHTNTLDPNSQKVTPDHTSTMTVYDSLGNPRSITVWYFQHGVNVPPGSAGTVRPTWDWYAFDTTFVQGSTTLTGEPDYFNCLGGTNISMDPLTGPGLVTPTAVQEGDVFSCIWFNQDGSLASNGDGWYVPPGGYTRQIHSLAAQNASDGKQHYGPYVSFDQYPNAQGIDPDGAMDMLIYLDFGTPNSWNADPASLTSGPTGATGTLRVNAGGAVGPNSEIDPAEPGLRDGLTGDVTGTYQTIGGVQQYVPNSTAYGKNQDGYRSGELVGLSVDTTGGIVGQFTNEKSITIAKIAVATFANQQGLAKAGDSLYSITSNSGTPRLTEAGDAGSATMQGGALESSNVDLSVELTNMIIAQRGFESNARIITTSADMLDTLVNVGR